MLDSTLRNLNAITKTLTSVKSFRHGHSIPFQATFVHRSLIKVNSDHALKFACHSCSHMAREGGLRQPIRTLQSNKIISD